MKPMRALLVFFFYIFAFPLLTFSDLLVPAMFGSNMVFQQGEPIRVWGWADPESQLHVQFAGQTQKALCDRAGDWEVEFPAMKATATPQTLSIHYGKTTLTYENILIGDVWFCSGQSNMDMALDGRIQEFSWRKGALNFEEEIAAADHPTLRLFHIKPFSDREKERRNCIGKWQPCSPKTVGTFSATAYFFGRDLQKSLGVPIGLIQGSVGGTSIEAWSSIQALYSTEEGKASVARWEKKVEDWNSGLAEKRNQERMEAWYREQRNAIRHKQTEPPRPPQDTSPLEDMSYPTSLFNGMLAPWLRFPVKGMIWYQGESNADNAQAYAPLFRTFIQDWRRLKYQGDIPFYFVQLANFEPDGRVDWPQIREAQRQALTLPNTGMAVAIDIGDPKDIHPRNKQAIGHRLARLALVKTYGAELVPSGPLCQSIERIGDKMKVNFAYADSGLVCSETQIPHFELSADGQIFEPAQAYMEGNSVMVWAEGIQVPKGVRYAWKNDPGKGLLYNKEKLPASPFQEVLPEEIAFISP
ncbi:MAG: sialate O-acetylesterase [bacterium]|nr:sialate O-acetylesterase [bacterium]